MMQQTRKKPARLIPWQMVLPLLAGALLWEPPGLLLGVFSSRANAAEMPELLPPDRLDIQDPFMRGLKRAVEERARLPGSEPSRFGLSAGALANEGEPAPPPLAGRQLDQLAAAADFRLAAVLSHVTETQPESDRQAGTGKTRQPKKAPAKTPLQPGIPRRAFIELGQAETAAPLQQLAADLEHRLGAVLGSGLSIRQRAGASHLEIGPLSSLLHAERTCLLLRRLAGGLLAECRVTLFLHGGEAPPAARALLRLSAAASKRLANSYPQLDATRLAGQLIWAKEGQMLGHDGYVIVRITAANLIAVNADGQIVRLAANAPAEQLLSPQQPPQHPLQQPPEQLGQN